MVSDEEIVEQLEVLLNSSDLETTTERMLREKLQEHFKEDLSSSKAFIRQMINTILKARQQEDGSAAQNEGEEDGIKQEESEEEEEAEEEEEEARPARGGGGGSLLSEAMQEFLGVESMPRPQVVKELWIYIKANNLQDPSNKRNIMLDHKLKTLFTPPLNMFSLNKQLSVTGVKRAASQPAKPRKAKKAKDGDDDAPRRSNNNFSKPLKLSQEMADFLGVPEASRGDITKRLWEYFKEHDLQDPADKRWILADDSLKALLGQARFQGFSISKLVSRHILS